METLPQVAARRLAFGLLALPVVLCGCIHDGQLVHWTHKVAGGEQVAQVVSTWQREVRYSPDPTHGGHPTPGLVGRVYLFGPEVGCPLVGDGSLVVDLYDDSHVPEGAEPVLLEEWRLDRDTMHRLQKRDIVGSGYSLFLPWGTYRPGLTAIHFQLCYKPNHGTPVWANSGPITLDNPVKGEVAAVVGANSPPKGDQMAHGGKPTALSANK